MTSNLQDQSRAADYWSQCDGEIHANGWLANPAVHERYNALACGDSEHRHWVNFCVRQFLAPHGSVERILSIGCGSGELERHLDMLDAANEIHGIDIARGQIESARRRAEEEGRTRLRYFVQAGESKFPADRYDAIFFNQSLHHIEPLEGVLESCAAHLGRDGYLFLNEYVGPDRFDLSARERVILQACFDLIPRSYRIGLSGGRLGQLLDKPSIPTPDEVVRVDPSESIRSSEILSLIPERFEVVVMNPIGGTILHFCLQDIAGHFREQDPDSMKILEMLFSIEDQLLSVGELNSHFVLVVARPKEQWPAVPNRS